MIWSISSKSSAFQVGRSICQQWSSCRSCSQPRLISHCSISGSGWLYKGVSAEGRVIGFYRRRKKEEGRRKKEEGRRKREVYVGRCTPHPEAYECVVKPIFAVNTV
ncbi:MULTISPECIES: hypothetical protein [Microcoleaceae]|uniref:hypothetical protein n=1 Tax=Lyngbya sp. CCAP 1446/10 TaxID=439293 RepID=UPI002AA2A99A|nr:hypothetical protein [Lyngbya sp. CCAP 1446/10]